MLNKKRKGFTIVELVIVIAVIAILATVLIPTFAGIIDKANESADKQAVRQMNIALAAEAIENEPADVEDVIDILADAGFNSTDKLVPVSAGHGFYWCKAANMIALIRDEGENSPQLIFPTEEAALNTAFIAAKTNWPDAIAGANVAFVDLEPAGEAAGLPTGGNGGSGEEEQMTPEQQLLKVLTEGGSFTLTGDMVISEAITIPAGATATIDLAGYTLAVYDSSDAEEVMNVSGSLTIQGTGKVVLNAVHAEFGINVEEGGTLTLENVSVDGSYCWNIANYGTTRLTNVQVTVPGGYGFANAGTATITGSTFTATGEYGGTTTIYNTGTLNISDTSIGESGSVSYYDIAAVLVEQGAVSMENVTVTTGADAYSVYAKSSSQVTIRGDESAFNTQFLCEYGTSCSFTIYGGTINGTAFKDITAASSIFLGGQHNLTPGENCWIIAPKS